jgi:lysophospholipase L1-like esterase
MWDSFLIFISKHPFWTVFSPIACSYLIGLISVNVKVRKFLYFAGLLSALVTATFLHLRWDSFSIHFLSNEAHSLKEKKILFLGDSITCEGARPRGFITKLKSVLALDAQIVCQKGATSEEIIQLFNSQMLDSIPDRVVVQAGINDLLGGSTVDQTIDAQQKLLSAISNRFPDSKVFFFPIHPIHYLEKNLAIPVDNESFWTNETNFTEKFLVTDGVHLNAKGHTLLAANILKLLA